MPHKILGLHHVTATVDDAQPDLDFAVGTLGLRLVKKTVNFDNHHVYHFYYGDERGAPGTIWTTFPYHGRGVRIGTKGAGQVTVTSFSVPAESLPFWKTRLTAARMSGLDGRDAAIRRGGNRVCRSVWPASSSWSRPRDDLRKPWTEGTIGHANRPSAGCTASP